MKENRADFPFSSTFISANCKDGFYSLYDSVFNMHDFERIFVLFGGPGTGKSTFLRGIAQKAKEEGVEVEEILCSSDPVSLDALILTVGGKKIGVLDGTPPHSRTITLPAVKEELIDLGAFWSCACIASHKEKILSLAERKKSAYKRAYLLLSALGSVCEEEYSRILPAFDVEKARRHIRHKIQACKQKGEVIHRFMRTFSTKGEWRAQIRTDAVQNLIFIGGNPAAAEIYLTYFDKILEEFTIGRTVFHSCLNPKSIDAIYLKETKTLLIKEELRSGVTQGRRIVADRFFRSQEVLEKAHRTIKAGLFEAAFGALKDAGEAHASMESYYIDGMDFARLEAFRKEKTLEILSHLKL